jgi:hypothetical protein
MPLTPPEGIASTEADLEQAVSAMRHVELDKLSEEQQEAKAEQLDKAWEVIKSAGEKGVVRLKGEVQLIDQTKEKDDFFKLGAAALLWEIGGLDYCGSIAEIWRGAPLIAQSNYVFYPAFEAACKQDVRALPMLTACLKERKGSVYVGMHALDLSWPLTQEFIWGAFGPRGLPVLAEILEESKDPDELRSAMVILSRNQYLQALPKVRELAVRGKGELQSAAIECLGIFGHPDDYLFLVSGLQSEDAEKQFSHAYALYEYEDLRIVQNLVPLLTSKDESLRKEVISCLMHMPTVESIEALHRHAASAEDSDEKEACEEHVSSILARLETNATDYFKKSPDEKAELIGSLRRISTARYELREEDRRLTHEELVLACEEWRKNHRVTLGDHESDEKPKYGWVKERHILSVATPDDLDLLREVKASLYFRLSDECLYEVHAMDQLIKRIGRSRYRKASGVREKVEENK